MAFYSLKFRNPDKIFQIIGSDLLIIISFCYITMIDFVWPWFTDLPNIFTTRPVALVLGELKHAVCRQWAEHVVLDVSCLDLYNLSPMSMYSMMMSVHGARKKSTDESSNAYGSLLAKPQAETSNMVSLSLRPYTNPIWIALKMINLHIRYDKKSSEMFENGLVNYYLYLNPPQRLQYRVLRKVLFIC